MLLWAHTSGLYVQILVIHKLLRESFFQPSRVYSCISRPVCYIHLLCGWLFHLSLSLSLSLFLHPKHIHPYIHTRTQTKTAHSPGSSIFFYIAGFCGILLDSTRFNCSRKVSSALPCKRYNIAGGEVLKVKRRRLLTIDPDQKRSRQTYIFEHPSSKHRRYMFFGRSHREDDVAWFYLRRSQTKIDCWGPLNHKGVICSFFYVELSHFFLI